MRLGAAGKFPVKVQSGILMDMQGELEEHMGWSIDINGFRPKRSGRIQG